MSEEVAACAVPERVGRGINGVNSDVGEVTFEADAYDSFRDRVAHATSSFPRVASRRIQGNSHTMNAIWGVQVAWKRDTRLKIKGNGMAWARVQEQ